MTAVGVRHDVAAKSLKLDRDFLRLLWVDCRQNTALRQGRLKLRILISTFIFVQLE